MGFDDKLVNDCYGLLEVNYGATGAHLVTSVAAKSTSTAMIICNIAVAGLGRSAAVCTVRSKRTSSSPASELHAASIDNNERPSQLKLDARWQLDQLLEQLGLVCGQQLVVRLISNSLSAPSSNDSLASGKTPKEITSPSYNTSSVSYEDNPSGSGRNHQVRDLSKGMLPRVPGMHFYQENWQAKRQWWSVQFTLVTFETATLQNTGRQPRQAGCSPYEKGCHSEVLRHVNIVPQLAVWPPNNATWRERYHVRYRMESLQVNTVADVLLCRPEMLEGPLHAPLLLLQALQGLQALHANGRAHGGLSVSNLLLHDLQCATFERHAFCRGLQQHLAQQVDRAGIAEADLKSLFCCPRNNSLAKILQLDSILMYLMHTCLSLRRGARSKSCGNNKSHSIVCARLVQISGAGEAGVYDQPAEGLEQVMQRWRTGGLSNYDYLLHLNALIGRRCGDRAFSPILPWVLDLSQAPEADSDTLQV